MTIGLLHKFPRPRGDNGQYLDVAGEYVHCAFTSTGPWGVEFIKRRRETVPAAVEFVQVCDFVRFCYASWHSVLTLLLHLLQRPAARVINQELGLELDWANFFSPQFSLHAQRMLDAKYPGVKVLNEIFAPISSSSDELEELRYSLEANQSRQHGVDTTLHKKIKEYQDAMVPEAGLHYAFGHNHSARRGDPGLHTTATLPRDGKAGYWWLEELDNCVYAIVRKVRRVNVKLVVLRNELTS